MGCTYGDVLGGLGCAYGDVRGLRGCTNVRGIPSVFCVPARIDGAKNSQYPNSEKCLSALVAFDVLPKDYLLGLAHNLLGLAHSTLEVVGQDLGCNNLGTSARFSARERIERARSERDDSSMYIYIDNFQSQAGAKIPSKIRCFC